MGTTVSVLAALAARVVGTTVSVLASLAGSRQHNTRVKKAVFSFELVIDSRAKEKSKYRLAKEHLPTNEKCLIVSNRKRSGHSKVQF